MSRNVKAIEGSTGFLSMPYEVVEHILRHLHKTKDLLNLAKSSKRCYQLALPCLYRHVNLVMGRLRTYPSLATNLKLHTAARSLRVCSRSTNPATDHKLPLIPSIKDNPANLSKKPFGKVDRAVFKHAQTTLCLLPHFQNLQSITLRGVPLPRSFYQSLHVLARLERLTLRACRLTTRYPRGYDPGTLGITELTLLQMRQNETSLPKLKGLLKLARSQALRTLRMDRSMEIALSSLVEYGLPHTLQRLELDFRGTVPRGRKPFELLFKFLNSCKHIRHLELTDMGKLDGLMEYPIRMQLRRDALPCLTSLTIPSAYVGLFTRSRNINSLTITDVVANHPPLTKHMELKDVASILRLLQISSITLESLKFNFNWWDKELFYMLAAMTNMVKELVITYQQGLPDDDFFMSLGNLIEFPHLERLYLYRPGSRMRGSQDTAFIDHKEYVVIWQRHMPNLREVALCSDVVWIRSQCTVDKRSKLVWTRYSVDPMDAIEGLVILPEAVKALPLERQLRMTFN